MSVKELIEALKLIPEDTEIRTEGCDCYGACSSLDLWEGLYDSYDFPDKKVKVVLLKRP